MFVPALKQQFESCARALSMNIEGITEEQALRQPEPGGNCVNWIVGHILASRNSILELLGEEPVMSPDIAERYGRGTDPIRSPEEAPASLAEMRQILEASQARIIGGLERMGERRLKEMTGKRSRAQQLAFMQFHEAYHVGQTGTLRRILGRKGAIP
jgi:uncharacterized damage-inducible protein DinB